MRLSKRAASLAAFTTCGLVLAYMTFMPNKAATKTPIERFVIAGTAGHVHERPEPVSVRYVDNRDHRFSVRFTDALADGRVDEVAYYDGERPLMTYHIKPNEAVAAGSNSRLIMDYDQFRHPDSGQQQFLWRRSEEARTLDSLYRDLVLAYAKSNPGSNLPERYPAPGIANIANIAAFGRWADEYLGLSRTLRGGLAGRRGEIAHLRLLESESSMRKAYAKLNDRERDAMFDWDSELGNDALEAGEKVLLILKSNGEHWSNWPRNPRESFQARLSGEQELDFIQSWSIFPELEKHKAEYRSDLKRRGFAF